MKARYVIGKKLLGTVPFMKAGSAAICLVATTMEAYVAYIKLQKARECLDSDKTKGNLTPGSDEYKAAYECAAKFYEIRVKEKTSLADKNAREDELQMKTNELRIEADKAEKAWKTEVAKVVAGIASTALGAFLMIHHDRFWAICSAGGVQVFDDRYRDGKMIYKDYGKKSV